MRVSTKDQELLRNLYERYKRTTFKGERDNCHQAILKILARYGLGWDDLRTIIEPCILDLLEELVERCIYMRRPQYVTACALWSMHMHIYDQFQYTPRLALLSPEPGWGKSQVMTLVRFLAPLPRPYLMINPTPAGLYQSIDSGVSALLVDEIDNLNLDRNGQLRSILNANQRDAVIPRGGSPGKGGKPPQPKFYKPFIPMAVGAIGRLPKPLKTRCVTIHMEQKPKGVIRKQADSKDKDFVAMADAVLGEIIRWRHGVVLDQNPDLSGIDNRYADNLRPLIAIADAFNRGEKARRVAKALIGEDIEVSEGILLFIDIRRVFNRLKVDRIERMHLLNELQKYDAWGDWAPSLLTKSKMLAILRDYGVPAVHPIRIGGDLVQGWYRKDFEEVWNTLCPPPEEDDQEPRAIEE
jgi:hypothetical protein